VQQASAKSAEAAKTSIAIHSNLLSRGEAALAETFHKRVSGSASTLGRLSDDASVTIRSRASSSGRSDGLGSARTSKSVVVVMCVSLCWVILVQLGAANAARTHVHRDWFGRVSGRAKNQSSVGSPLARFRRFVPGANSVSRLKGENAYWPVDCRPRGVIVVC
jgi:hypothetical protein